MIVSVPLHALLAQVRRLAQRTSEELLQAQLRPEDLWGIARHYGLTLGWAVPCEALAFRRRVFAVFHVGLGEGAS